MLIGTSIRSWLMRARPGLRSATEAHNSGTLCSTSRHVCLKSVDIDAMTRSVLSAIIAFVLLRGGVGQLCDFCDHCEWTRGLH